MQDPYFVRVWRAMQLKKAGIPVMELITHIDDALAIQAVEAEVEHLLYEQAKDRAGEPDEGA